MTRDTLSLSELRASIDNLDAAIVHLLAERIKITDIIALYKHQHDLSVRDKDRENKQIQHYRDCAQKTGADPDIIELLFRLLFSETVKRHKNVRNNTKKV